MSCQSLAARAFAEPDKDPSQCVSFHRSVRFSSESRSSNRVSNEPDCKRDASGGMSLSSLSVTPLPPAVAMSQSAPPASITFDLNDETPPSLPSCRFPKLEECAHFHYERVSLGGLNIETVPCEEQCEDNDPSDGWICLRVRSHVSGDEISLEPSELQASAAAWSEPGAQREWTLTRSRDNFLQLDDMLHRCIYDRKVSGLPNLSEELRPPCDDSRYHQLIGDYVHHLSIIADDSINCGPVLNWLQMDNKGHKLLVANEDSSSINTPAVAAAYSVRKYVSQARDEISFEVGDMISIIDMPGPQESVWWRGKRGFRVGFFPRHCVAVIGDKVPRHMTQPPPIVGSVAVAPIKPVLRKHGKLISLFRSFILSRPSRRSLKQQGILKERVFGCDLGEHLLNCGHDVPQVLAECARAIERRGAVDGVYRLSGGAALTQRLRAAFDAAGDAPPDLAPPLQRDPHALASLLKMYFRCVPLLPFILYSRLYAQDALPVRATPPLHSILPPLRSRCTSGACHSSPSFYTPASTLKMHFRCVPLLPFILYSRLYAQDALPVRATPPLHSILPPPTSRCAFQDALAGACHSSPSFYTPASTLKMHFRCVPLLPFILYSRLYAQDALPVRATPPLHSILPPLRSRCTSGACPRFSLGRHSHVSIELPNPLCTYQLYDSFVSAVQIPDETARLKAMRETVVKLPPPHYRTLAHLMRHLRRVSLLSEATGMTARNMAIVWAPNLLRSPAPQHALQGVAVQAVVTEFLICYAEELFAQEQGADSGPDSLEQDHFDCQVELRGNESCRRPKSLPLNPPTKLLSLEEARRRGVRGERSAGPPPSGAIAAAAAAPCAPAPRDRDLRPAAHLKPKYIEVGSGPNNLPQYHTVLDLPLSGGKRGLKRSPSGWRGLFSRSKLQRARAPPQPPPQPLAAPAPPHQEASLAGVAGALRPVKSCESLASDTDTLPPLNDAPGAPLKHHTRSASCDSYFEPWQAELAHMRLRLAPQERDHHMFSEEDDHHHQRHQHDDLESPCSCPCSATHSPSRRPLGNARDTDGAADAAADADRRRAAMEEQVAQMGFIDGESPRAKPAPEKRHGTADADPAKRICKDRESPLSSLQDFQNSGSVKLRERHSPRKGKAAPRHSHHQPPAAEEERNGRLTWHGREGHSTLIRIDWPADDAASSVPSGPPTPAYEILESDSEPSENRRGARPERDCAGCRLGQCLECELRAADHSTDASCQNLNRLSAVSTSSNSSGRRRDGGESSPSHSNNSPTKHSDDLYECFDYSRPTYINLQSSSTSKSSPGSPLRSPLKSTISITFRSPTMPKLLDYETVDNETPTNDRDSVYEDIDLEKNLSIVEEASVPETDASLPTQQAHQPEAFGEDLIILETPTERTDAENNADVYSQVKFFRKSIEEVNAMILESPERETAELERHYENVAFPEPIDRDYENINVDALKIRDKVDTCADEETNFRDDDDTPERDNGNVVKRNAHAKNLNVRELAIRFESPTEQKGPFTFDKFKAEIKYPSLERHDEDKKCEPRKKELAVNPPPPPSPKTYKLSKNSTRSLDESAFIKEFGGDSDDRRKTGHKIGKHNADHGEQDLAGPAIRDEEARSEEPHRRRNGEELSRERIEKYKEERRNFLREKYSSQSFRSNPEQLTRIRIKKETEDERRVENCERLHEELPKFERRNTVDLGQRMRFSLARSSNNLDTIQSPLSPVRDLDCPTSLDFSKRDAIRRDDRKEKVSPSYNIRDMAAIFEQKSQNSNG
ncbi:unnamed protein product, partial [Iphiclides podalirius]